MKVCPVCKSRCFDDMDVCYGCLHKFNDEQVEEVSNNKDLSGFDKTIKMDKADILQIPEYFELDSFPMVEEVESQRPRGAHEKTEEGEIITIKIPIDVLKSYLVLD